MTGEEQALMQDYYYTFRRICAANGWLLPRTEEGKINWDQLRKEQTEHD